MRLRHLLLLSAVALPLVLPAIVAGEDGLAEDRARAAFADRDYDRAVALLKSLNSKAPDDPDADYRSMMVVRGLMLAEHNEAAVEAGERFLARHAESRFVEKVAFLTARAMLLTGRGAEADELMAASLERLSGPELRSRIARFYIDAADHAFAGAPAKGPFDKPTPPDFARAQRLYGLALEAGIPAELRRDSLLSYAEAAYETKGFKLATDVLDERRKGLDGGEGSEAALLRGRSLIAAGQTSAGQAVLAALVAEAPASAEAPEALFLIGNAASLDRLVREHPTHPKAPEAALRQGLMLVEQGLIDRAVASLLAAADKFRASDIAPKALRAAADALFGAERYEEAQARYDEFLRRHPEHADWAKVRDQLTEAWFQRGVAAAKKDGVDTAAPIWTALREKFPLSPYAPRTLAEEARHRRGPAQRKLLGELLARYPQSPEAPGAALSIAHSFARESGRIEEAIRAFREVGVRYPGSDAARSAASELSTMQEESLSLRLPGTVRPGEKPRLEINTRNLKQVSGRVYRIDPVAYFTRNGSLGDLHDVMVEVVAPDAVFSHQVLDYEDFRTVTGKMDVPVEGEGAYIVVVEGAKKKATCLLLVSGVSVITKAWPTGALAFVTDRDGQPLPGARVLVRKPDGTIVDSSTGPDGTAKVTFPERLQGVSILAAAGASVAFDSMGSARGNVRALETRFHVAPDRPVYRPGDTVKYRAVVRRSSGTVFETPAGERALVIVTDRAGNELHRLDTKLGEFGTVAGEFALPADIPPASYPIAIRVGEDSGSAEFHVEAYRKPQIFLEIGTKKPVYVRGEAGEILVTARYAFGRPVPGLPLEVVLHGSELPEFPDRYLPLETNAEGKVAIPFTTHPGPDARIEIEVRARDATRRAYYSGLIIPVTATEYTASLSFFRQSELFTGDEVRVEVLTSDALGNPVAAKGKIEVAVDPRSRTPRIFAVEKTYPVETGEDGKATLAVPLDKTGAYRFTWRGVDRAGREVLSTADLGDVGSSERRLVVRAENPTPTVGDVLRVTVRSPEKGIWALLAIEAEEVIVHRAVRLTEEETTHEFEVARAFAPNVWITGAALAGELKRGEDQIRVREILRLKVTPDRKEYGPGELCRLDVLTTDEAGKPLPAEVAVSVVDEALYLIRADGTPDIAAFFTAPNREHMVLTGSSAGFDYDGRTDDISADLLAERERRKSAEDAKPGLILAEKSLKDSVETDADAPYEDSVGIGGGAGGGFGGRGGHRNLKPLGGGAPAESLFPARERFEDAAYYNARVVTGPDGRATVEFVLPDDLTEWRITARGATHANGFATDTGSITTSRPLVIRVALPRYLREGDEVTGGAGVVNGLDHDGVFTVDLSPSRDVEELRVTLDIPAGGERLADWPLPVSGIGELTLTARATTEGMPEDAEIRKLRVLPFGVPWRTGFSGLATDPADHVLVLPADRVPGTEKLTLIFSPSVARAAIEGWSELREFPYGCTEQTVNRFLPALELRAALRALGAGEAKELARLDEIAKAGALRLTYLQNKEGLWGWWPRGGSNAEMTAYALVGLARARAAGIEFSGSTFERAKPAVKALLARTTDPETRAFLHLGAAWAFGPDFETLAPAFTDRAKLGVRGLACLALAYEPLGKTAQGTLLVAEIESALRGRPSLDGIDTEALGFAIAALGGGDRLTLPHPAVDAVLMRREGRGFGTTRQTGAVVMGLARAARIEGLGGRSDPVGVLINGTPVKSPGTARTPLPAGLLKTGENRIRVSGTGGSFAVLFECVRRETPVNAGPLSVARRLTLVPMSGAGESETLLRPDGIVKEPQVDKVRIGEPVRVTLTVRTGGERYLVVEDSIPAGFEPIPDSEAGPAIETTRYDDRIVFFLENPADLATITYVMQAEVPGRVRAPAAVVYPMYRPSAAAYGAEMALAVFDFGQEIDRDPTIGYSAGDLWTAAQTALREGRAAETTNLLNTLLTRYELRADARVMVLRVLAEAFETLGEPANVIGSYDRLLAEVPSFTPTSPDERRRAKAFRALGRHGDAISSMERVAWHFFTIDAGVSEAVGGEQAAAILAEILDRYPFSAAAESAWILRTDRAAQAFGTAAQTGGDPDPAELAMIREFLARYPESTRAPQAAFHLARAMLRSGRFEDLEKEARRFGDRWPGHALADDADWFVVYALFAQGRHDEAAAAARASLEKTYTQDDGGKGGTAYELNLIHLLAEVAHVKGRLDEAVELYRKVADRSIDAREALKELTEVRLTAPDVVRVRPGDRVAVAVGLRNLSVATVDMYPVDLLAYFAIKKDVQKVSGLNLDGLPPKQTLTVNLPSEGSRRLRTTDADLGPLAPGVYLAITRSAGLERRTVVVVSNLEAEIREHKDGVRVVVVDGATGNPVPAALVKLALDGMIIGEGRTDPRGIFEVRGRFSGGLTAVAESAGSFALAVE